MQYFYKIGITIQFYSESCRLKILTAEGVVRSVLTEEQEQHGNTLLHNLKTHSAASRGVNSVRVIKRPALTEEAAT